MKHLAIALSALLLAAPLTGCLAEEGDLGDQADDLLDAPASLGESAQEVGRGWFGLQQNGLGYATNPNAAGLSQELSINYTSQGYGYAYAYAQRWNWSPAVNHVTMIVRVDCADGQYFFNSIAYVLSSNGASHIGISTPDCPRYVRAVSGYFAMYVDN